MGLPDTDMAALFAAREGERWSMHSRHLNEQMVRVLRTIGYDVGFCRGAGQYLYDRDGARYLDLLSGFGVFAIGRNHPVVRDALQSVLDGELPNLVQMDVSALAGVLAERLLARVPYLDKVFFANSGAEAVEAAIKFARTATGRPGIVYCEHAFHGLSYGALSLNGDDDLPRAASSRSCPDCVAIPFNDLAALEQALAARTSRPSSSSRSRARASTCPPTTICATPPSCAAATARCSSPTRSRPGSAAPAASWRSSTGASSPTWC